MNFHTDEWIMNKMREHYNDALLQYPEHRIVGVFYQGSGNYGMDYEDSDVDTKCVIVPTINQLVGEQKTSKTHIRDNDEHIDFKDIRIMLETFRKCNLNFLEILYTKYCIINPIYAEEWNKLVQARDIFVSLHPELLLKSLKGIAGEKYHAMEHRYPSRIEWLDKFGYDPKQLHHLFRIEEFMDRWLAGESFADCLVAEKSDWLVEIKKGKYNLEQARTYGKETIGHIQMLYDIYIERFADKHVTYAYGLSDEVARNIIKIGITKELENDK